MSDLKEMFVEYDRLDVIVDEAKAALEKATVARSQSVKEIATAISPKKKLLRNGRELTLVTRGETYFFRGSKNMDDLVEV